MFDVVDYHIALAFFVPNNLIGKKKIFAYELMPTIGSPFLVQSCLSKPLCMT